MGVALTDTAFFHSTFSPPGLGAADPGCSTRLLRAGRVAKRLLIEGAVVAASGRDADRYLAEWSDLPLAPDYQPPELHSAAEFAAWRGGMGSVARSAFRNLRRLRPNL
jgi:hypothetical protein